MLNVLAFRIFSDAYLAVENTLDGPDFSPFSVVQRRMAMVLRVLGSQRSNRMKLAGSLRNNYSV